MAYKNNNVDYVMENAYRQAEHSELLKFLTKELNGLGNLGGPSSSVIELQIKQLQEELKKAERREEIVNVLLDYDLDIHTMPDAENVGKTICFIGYRDEFSNRFLVQEREKQVECDD